MSSNHSTPTTPIDFTTSPLIQLPGDPARHESRLFAARMTLDQAHDALAAIITRLHAEDEYGLSLLLQCVGKALQHAESLLYVAREPLL